MVAEVSKSQPGLTPNSRELLDPGVTEKLDELREGASEFINDVLSELESGFYDELDELTAIE
jgi:hypothetical protein